MNNKIRIMQQRVPSAWASITRDWHILEYEVIDMGLVCALFIDNAQKKREGYIKVK